MFGLSKKERQERRTRNNRSAERRGYKWARTAFFIEGMPLQEIADLASGLPRCVETDQGMFFDLGAREAIREIQELFLKTPNDALELSEGM